MAASKQRAGIVGAGYISEYHVDAIKRQANVDLVAICDLNVQAAKRLAGNANVEIYDDIDRMLQVANLDVVHVLTQPDSHFFLAKKAIEAGSNVILEKPVTTNSQEAIQMAELAKANNVTLAINHNFVFSRPFNELKQILDRGELGPIKSIRVVWKKMLAQMTYGPWNLWMLKAPGNILFETGSHSLSELLAVLNEDPVIKTVDARLPKQLPSGAIFYKRWNITGMAGNTSIQIDTAFDQGYEQHFIEVEGMFGVAKADIENDIFTSDQPTGRAYDTERLHVNMNAGLKRAKQAVRTYGSYAASKFIKSFSGAPYQTSMLNGIKNCYDHLEGKSDRKESSIEYAISIAKTAEAIQEKLPPLAPDQHFVNPTLPIVTEPKLDAEVLILGATGFIGKKLLMSLLEKGTKVRALVRNPSALAGLDIDPSLCEIMIGDFHNEEIINKVVPGIDVVYHLATAHGKSLSGYLKSNLDPTKMLAQVCKANDVKRFIFTGTIDSLYLGPDAGAVKESDGVDDKIKYRNNYAHSKAITEDYLNDLYRNEKFPVVIIRPAIVLGVGGPINHTGVANWFGLGRCAYWGKGENPIPIVLVEDVVSGLIKAKDTPDIEGNTYNLSADSSITAREYVEEVEKVMGSKIMAAPSSAYKGYVGEMFKWGIKVLARHPDGSRIPSVRDWKCREQHASFDTTKAQQDLNWYPINDKEILIERGIREPARVFLEG